MYTQFYTLSKVFLKAFTLGLNLSNARKAWLPDPMVETCQRPLFYIEAIHHRLVGQGLETAQFSPDLI